MGYVACNLSFAPPYLSNETCIIKMGLSPSIFLSLALGGLLWHLFLRLRYMGFGLLAYKDVFRLVVQMILVDKELRIYNVS